MWPLFISSFLLWQRLAVTITVPDKIHFGYGFACDGPGRLARGISQRETFRMPEPFVPHRPALIIIVILIIIIMIMCMYIYIYRERERYIISYHIILYHSSVGSAASPACGSRSGCHGPRAEFSPTPKRRHKESYIQIKRKEANTKTAKYKVDK